MRMRFSLCAGLTSTELSEHQQRVGVAAQQVEQPIAIVTLLSAVIVSVHASLIQESQPSVLQIGLSKVATVRVTRSVMV